MGLALAPRFYWFACGLCFSFGCVWIPPSLSLSLVFGLNYGTGVHGGQHACWADLDRSCSAMDGGRPLLFRVRCNPSGPFLGVKTAEISPTPMLSHAPWKLNYVL